MMKTGTDWRKASKQFSRDRFKNLSIKLKEEGSLNSNNRDAEQSLESPTEILHYSQSQKIELNLIPKEENICSFFLVFVFYFLTTCQFLTGINLSSRHFYIVERSMDQEKPVSIDKLKLYVRTKCTMRQIKRTIIIQYSTSLDQLTFVFVTERLAYIHPYIIVTSKLYLMEKKMTETGNFCGHSKIISIIFEIS